MKINFAFLIFIIVGGDEYFNDKISQSTVTYRDVHQIDFARRDELL